MAPKRLSKKWKIDPSRPGLSIKFKVNRFAAFNPDERVILGTLLQDHANTVSVISQSVEGAIDIHAYLATIEALENECRRS